MKCNIQRQKVKHSSISSMNVAKLNSTNKYSEFIDLDSCFFHGIGTYLEPYQRLNRLRAILDCGAILSESSQPEAFGVSNKLSKSPKCNGKDNISICQRMSFTNPNEVSESFNCFVSNGISIILDKDMATSIDVKNEFDAKCIWEWLDGEYRVKDRISSMYFVGIGFPSRSLEEVAFSFKELRCYSLRDSVAYMLDCKWYKELESIQHYLNYNDIELPIYSVVSGKPMGDFYSAFAKAYNVNPDEVFEICRNLQEPDYLRPNSLRVGTMRDLHSCSQRVDYDEFFDE